MFYLFRRFVSFTQGSDALILEDGSYASEAILDLDILEGLAPGGDS